MLPESEKRASELAVSRFGAEVVRVQRIYQQILQAQARGQTADLLDTLVQRKLLTAAQAQELRAGLDTTHVDDKHRPSANGTVPPIPAGTESGQSDLRLLGEYRILRRLGEGGMGSVYLGYQESENKYVALKVLPDLQATNQVALDRFYREAKSGALLNHPNIVRNLAVGQDRVTGKHYLVMEYVDGTSALELLQRHGRLSIGDGVHIILDVARALEHAHSRNIVHRDIKPDNILITLSGVAKLGDLGLAKRTDEASHLTAARQGFGTPYYMPYEQAMNAKYADGRSDIYALGATLYHLVTGELPFPGTNHLEIVEKKSIGAFPPASLHSQAVPPVLDDILARMLARDPADRYQTVSELIVDLERANLAAPVPSFVDADLAMKDPLVRERVTAPAQPTAPDLQVPDSEARSELRKGKPDIWYLRYRDQSGRWCKAKATTQQVLQRLGERRFPADIEGGHHHNGEFQPLGEFAEFRSAVLEAAKGRKPRHRGKGRMPASDTANQQSGGEWAPGLQAWLARRWWLVAASAIALVLIIVSAVFARLLW
jgi:serine/threonine-protein kinase